jgi:F-type H+-transporting ATPase subunit b
MEIQFPQILLQAVNFGLLLFLLTKLLYKPVLKVLDERSDRIDKGLLAASKNLEEQEKIESTKKSEIQKAQREAQKMLDEAKAEAQKMSKDILDKAKAEASLIAKKETAALEAKLAIEQQAMTRRLSDLIILTTKSALRDTLKAEHQEEIINQQIKLLGKLQVN